MHRDPVKNPVERIARFETAFSERSKHWLRIQALIGPAIFAFPRAAKPDTMTRGKPSGATA
jgi:hypothetical protein